MLLPLSTSGERSGFQDPKLSLLNDKWGYKEGPCLGTGNSWCSDPPPAFPHQCHSSPPIQSILLRQGTATFWYNLFLSHFVCLHELTLSSHYLFPHLIGSISLWHQRARFKRLPNPIVFHLCFTFLDISYKLIFYNFTLLEIQALKHSVLSAFLLSLHSHLNP